MSPKNLKNPKAVKAAFAKVLNDFNEEELLEMEALAIGHAYLSEAQRIMDERGMLKKDLAEKMNVSPSFLTQLFRGDRPVSDYHKAQLARIFNIQWELRAVPSAKPHAKARGMGPSTRPASMAAEPAAKYGRSGTGGKRAGGGKA
ncbi:MAG: helix-turn-helix domain-containing protein [Flavobacteriales bacterium]|nr:helix-turn-helix domain-containing protein [Flavobacteriales bacterium]MCC6939424.1 helix-turn-helix domain-containing protein [Flavobacteriales bacterium]